jgi:hypothetical protein
MISNLSCIFDDRNAACFGAKRRSSLRVPQRPKRPTRPG